MEGTKRLSGSQNATAFFSICAPEIQSRRAGFSSYEFAPLPGLYFIISPSLLFVNLILNFSENYLLFILNVVSSNTIPPFT